MTIKPCIPKEFGNCEVNFEYLNKKFCVKFNYTQGKSKKVTFNGKVWEKVKKCEQSGKKYPFFADGDMNLENELTVDY